MATIDKRTFQFLNQLKRNNNRDWFNQNKKLYTQAQENVIDFSDALLELMNKHDTIETPNGKKSLYRIYRDVRFSKDKSPYKTWFSGHYGRATKALRGGYYFHIEPGNVFAAGGFWGPNKDDLLLIRQQIQAYPDDIRQIVQQSNFKDYFGELKGEQLKTAPKGFEKDDPAIDFLRYKQFLLVRQLEIGPNLMHDMNETYQAMRPFFDYMSDILTTDLNGVSVL